MLPRSKVWLNLVIILWGSGCGGGDMSSRLTFGAASGSDEISTALLHTSASVGHAIVSQEPLQGVGRFGPGSTSRLLASIEAACPGGAKEMRPLAHTRWQEGHVTDAQGDFFAVAADQRLNVALEGPFIRLHEGSTGALSPWEVGIAKEGDHAFVVQMDEAQLDAYFYIQEARAWALRLVDASHPAWLWLQKPLDVTVNAPAAACNIAYFDGKGLTFTTHTCGNTARVASMVRHEYGHALHAAASGVNTSTDRAMSEAVADYVAIAIAHDPNLREASMCDISRSCENTLTYCQSGCDAGPDAKPYLTAQVLCAAWWDLRQQLGHRFGRPTGDDIADGLFLRTLAKPLTVASAYQTLIEVDDDDDLNWRNGTQHSCEINRAVAGTWAQPRFIDTYAPVPCVVHSAQP